MSTTHRLVNFVLTLLIFVVEIDLGTPFSIPSPPKSSSTLSNSPLSPLDSCITYRRPHVGKTKNSCHLLAKNDSSDGSDSLGMRTSNGDEKLTWNWLFGLVIPLQLVYISNQLSRSSIYYLVDFSIGTNDATAPDPFRAMNIAIGFSEAQYGLLASLAFTALFAIASLGAGAAADKYNRKILTVLSAVGWSIAIIGTSFSSTYNEVLLWRIAMGLFCAFSTPTAYTLITEKVPKDRLSLATSIYGTGVAFGGAFASLSLLLDNQVGWSQTLLIIGVVGLVCALVVGLVIPNDDSNTNDGTTSAIVDVSTEPDLSNNELVESYSFVDGVLEALSTTRAKWIFGGSFLRFSSGLCIGVWSAPFFRAAFPDYAGEYAVAQAFITAVAGSISGVAGGFAADYVSSAFKKGGNEEIIGDTKNQDLTGARLWVPVAGSLLAAPTWYLAIDSTESFQIAMIWLTIEYLVAECWFGPTISTLLSTVPSKVGGTAQGLFTLTGGVANLSPTLLGYLVGQASSTATAIDSVENTSLELLPLLLKTAVCFGYISSAFCFTMGALSVPPPVTKSKSD